MLWRRRADGGCPCGRTCGVQVYCGGWLKKDGNPGKGDSKVTYRRGVALETQFYPDSLHCPNFPVEFVKAGVPFTTTTEFRFDTK